MRTASVHNTLPTRFIRLGEQLVRYGKTLVCVRRPDALSPGDACRGCWFRSNHRAGGVGVNCQDIQCSVWDRRDGEDVWFVEK